jgi:hypothetical protein
MGRDVFERKRIYRYTPKNGAVYYVFSMETAPFFCVYPVLRLSIPFIHVDFVTTRNLEGASANG